VTATPIKDELSGESRALVFFRDIFQKALAGDAPDSDRKNVEHRVLATGIAHEINNPIAAVAGCAEAMQRRFRDDPNLAKHDELDVFPNYLNVIVRESYRCKSIIDQLLGFSRKSEGVAVCVDLNEVVQEILDLLRHHRAIGKFPWPPAFSRICRLFLAILPACGKSS